MPKYCNKPLIIKLRFNVNNSTKIITFFLIEYTLVPTWQRPAGPDLTSEIIIIIIYLKSSILQLRKLTASNIKRF